MDRVLLTCSKGAESVVSAEAARKLGATGVRAYTGKVTCEVPAASLCRIKDLKSAERAFVLVQDGAPLILPPYKKDGYAALVRAIESLPWLEALQAWRRAMKAPAAVIDDDDDHARIPPLPPDHSSEAASIASTSSQLVRIRVTCKPPGSKNHAYQASDLAAKISSTLTSLLGWLPDAHGHLIEIMVHLSDERTFIAIYLPQGPVVARPYLLSYGLRSTTAYCLASLAGIRPGDVVLDPFCGHGTIAVEASVENPAACVLASDLDPTMVKLAVANTRHADRQTISVMQSDATHLPHRERSVDVVVTDLPFGKKHGAQQDIGALIGAFTAECVRVVRIGGRVVVMTYHEAALARAIQQTSEAGLVIRAIQTFRLGKLDASVFIVDRVQAAVSPLMKHPRDESSGEPRLSKQRRTAEE